MRLSQQKGLKPHTAWPLCLLGSVPVFLVLMFLESTATAAGLRDSRRSAACDGAGIAGPLGQDPCCCASELNIGAVHIARPRSDSGHPFAVGRIPHPRRERCAQSDWCTARSGILQWIAHRSQDQWCRQSRHIIGSAYVVCCPDLGCSPCRVSEELYTCQSNA